MGDQPPPIVVTESELLTEITLIAKRCARKRVLPYLVPDLAQEVMLECLVKIRNGTWEQPESLPAFVHDIIVKRVQDQGRRKKRSVIPLLEHCRVLDETPRDWMSPELAIEEGELAELRRSLIRRLPEACQRVYLLVRHESLTYGKVAKRLGISRSTVNAHVVRAQAFMRRELVKRGIAVPATQPVRRKTRKPKRRPANAVESSNSSRYAPFGSRISYQSRTLKNEELGAAVRAFGLA